MGFGQLTPEQETSRVTARHVAVLMLPLNEVGDSGSGLLVSE